VLQIKFTGWSATSSDRLNKVRLVESIWGSETPVKATCSLQPPRRGSPNNIIPKCPPSQITTRKVFISSFIFVRFLILGLSASLFLFFFVFLSLRQLRPLMASEKSIREYGAAQSSVYLITSDGRTLELPIPSRSPNDPLRWSLLKRITVMGVISVFTIVGLILVQGTSLLLLALENEYSPEV
jgi:hypothetical protein